MTITTSLAGSKKAFALSVLEGLQRTPKQISSKYFYDEHGDRLFQQIMRMPSYYLTDSEYEIFDRQKGAILQHLGDHPFDLIELGAGDGLKTKVLLRHLLENDISFKYRPVDISSSVLNTLQESLRTELPDLEVAPLHGEYFQVLEGLQQLGDHQKKVIFFLGANIGNLTREESQAFLSQLNNLLAPGDMLLLGVDLKKDPAVILEAYNDAEGITAAFNLNLLHRINRELDGNFKVDQFKHWETYNPLTGETKSYIVSKLQQEVEIGAISSIIHCDAWEAIEVELSQKYSVEEVQQLARVSGFQVVKNFFDSKRYFIDTLWIKS
ncbi:MAG: L-histidine N(alpha)-methyltransferase [Saprospiraceae bacterium]|nr:L-histidine N(alpha)-methyltransferase [Saprospiraceae bacterium]